MNIPFYRYVEYGDDGHFIYQCLQCGGFMDVGYVHYDFNPRFCFRCGVEYQGFILPKNKDYIQVPTREALEFYVEIGLDWNDGDEIQWDESWRRTDDAKQALELLNGAREEMAEKNKEAGKFGEWKCRLSHRKRKRFRNHIFIDVDKYEKRTGKKFNRDDYQRTG